MADMIGTLISILLPIIIIIFCTLYLAKMFKDLTKGLGPKPKTFSPQNIGDRLKKYIIVASKCNPSKVKVLKLRRTKFNEGGTLGWITGVVVTGDCTKFVFKKMRYIGFRQVLYCPSYMHGNLHSREVFLDAISIENISGFFFPLPYDQTNIEPYKLSFDAFKKDLKKMERMDTQQVEVEQIISSMIGEYEQEQIITSDDELPMRAVGDEDYA